MNIVPVHPENAENEPSPQILQCVGLKWTSERQLSPEKAAPPIVVTELPIVKTPEKPVQPTKALSPISLTEFGIVRSPVKPVQFGIY